MFYIYIYSTALHVDYPHILIAKLYAHSTDLVIVLFAYGENLWTYVSENTLRAHAPAR